MGDRDTFEVSVDEHWRSLCEGSPDYIFTVSLDGLITYVNRTAAGLDAAQVVGKSMLDFLAAEDRPRVQALLDQVRASGRAGVMEAAGVGDHGKLAHYQSHYLPVTRDGQVISFLVLTRDVSEARLARQALATSERRFRSLIENSPDAICMVEASGRIIYANPSTTRILDYPYESLVGVLGWEFIHPDDGPMVGDYLQRLLAQPGASLAFPRYRMRHRDGSWRYVEVMATNLLAEPGVNAIVSNFRDVTVSLQLEEQLRQAQKMEAIGLLAGGVAHDFNNLLTVVLGFAEHAALELPKGHPATSDLVNVQRAAQTAADLTRKLLAFSRRQVLRAVNLDLHELVVHFVGTVIGRILGEDVTVELALGDDPLPMRGDPVQLQQVLLNLCTNARQAMPDGGRLRIALRRLAGEPSRAELVVSDTGAGMDEETRRRIYEPFFSGHGGTGLGMSVVYGVIQDHRGSIEVESTPGGGTSVRIFVPIEPAGAQAAGPVQRDARPAIRGNETLLVAEDQPLVRDLLVRTLRQLGYTVLPASDGQEAVEIFEREAARISLVVLDAIMPRAGGRQAFVQMQARRPDLPALFVSGYAPEASNLGELTTSGRVGFLHKPFATAELASKVRELLDAAVSRSSNR